MPRVLFITTKIGFGHQKVSNTLATAIKEVISGCITKTVTYFDFFPPGFQSIINTIYVYGLKWFPNVFGYIYLAQKRYKGHGVRFWSRFLGRKYAELIKDYSPQLIVITQGLACQWLGELKKKGLVNVPIAAVITDFVVHPFWVHPEISLYIVATQEMKEDLISRGIASSRITASGIPIDTRFSTSYNKTQIKSDKITVLIMGGGWGLGRMDRLLVVIDKIDLPLELLVVTGRNRALYRRLKGKRFKHPVHIYGRVDNISELMAASEIIITKAGGVTVSELLASGLPAILWDIIPGQEEANARYLVNAGVAVEVDDINEMIISREVMSRLSKNLGRPASTMEAVRCLKGLIV